MDYYFIHCLFDIIPVEHLECWRHFVLAPRLLSKSILTQDEPKVADNLFLQFGKRFDQLYCRESVTPKCIVIWLALLMILVQLVNFGYFYSKNTIGYYMIIPLRLKK